MESRLFKSVIFSVLLLSLSLTQGCTSTRGPINSPEFERLVINSSDEKVLLFGPGIILPGVDGFELFSNILYSNQNQPGNSAGKGVLVCSDKSFSLYKWDKKNKKYNKDKSIHYKDMQLLELRKFGLGTRIVISDNSLGIYSYEFVEPNESFIDANKNEQAYKLMWKLKNENN